MLPDLYTYLATDGQLLSLVMGATAESPRIFPEYAPADTPAPYIVYGPTKEGSMDEVMDMMTVQISVFGSEFDMVAVNKVIIRLKELLDKQDQIQGLIPSSKYIYYWSKHIGGMADFSADTREYHRAAMFAFKFKVGNPVPYSGSLWDFVDGNLQPKSKEALDAYFQNQNGNVEPT